MQQLLLEQVCDQNLPSKNLFDARRRARLGGVHGDNLRVRAVAAHEMRVELPRRIPVGGVAAAAGDEAQVFDAVGGFDEQYFMYWEDADFCRRLRARGYTTRYVPTAIVSHVVGGSSGGAARSLTIREFHRSAYRYYRAHVARGPLSRGAAWLLLQGRCWYKLLRARQHAS